MQITFVEVQPWEKDILQQHFPNAKFLTDRLLPENIQDYTDTEILSSFIYSPITKEIIEKMPQLKYITTRSTGFDNIDIATCKDKNIPVSNVPEYGSNTVAEFTIGLLLDVTRKITQAVLHAKQMDFQHQNLQGIDLNGKTIGIVGLGKIGKQVLRIAQGFGMNALVYNHSQDAQLAETLHFHYADLETVLKTADVITLHVPFTPETHHIINTNNILLFKKGSYLINTARGGLIDTQAIMIGLEQEILAGVGLDVLEGENELTDEIAILNVQSQTTENLKTLLYDHMLLNHPKVVITPHNAFNTKEALLRILDVTMANINGFLNNAVQNTISTDK